MTSIDLGNYSLGLALMVSAAALMASVAAARLDSVGFLNVSRGLMGLLAGLLTFASALLLMALLDSDFRLQYVAQYSERALPSGYKAAAFWAGQAGSLLFWAWILAVMNLILILTQRFSTGREVAATIGVLAIVTGFFTSLMLFAANPFEPTAVVPADGSGLNPMLQNFGMIVHPPLLFLGYAGYTIPFAMMIGAMIAGRSDNRWLDPVRRWSLFSWLLLMAGIVWGAQWAYTELGWGGYWAWDPVENASLLPWLTGTALLHSLFVQRQRGIFKRWNVSLIAASFILCIFGTYLTRSGVIQSVHSFGKHPIGNFFVVFIIIALLATISLLVWRRRQLAPERPLDNLISRDGAILATNTLLSLMTAVVLVGTISPLLSAPILGRSISVEQSFYNTVVAPMGLALVAVMALGPILRDGPGAGQALLRSLAAPAIAALAAVLTLIVAGLHNPWAVAAASIIALALAAVVADLLAVLRQRVRATGQHPLMALPALIDANHRRYGGHLTHIGVAMMVAGIAGSSLFGQTHTHQFKPGASAQVAGYTFTFNSLDEVRQANHTAVVADMTVVTPGGAALKLYPERRFFDKAENAYSQVAIHWTLREDLYLLLAGWETGGQIVAIQVMVNPMVVWIWIGGIVMAVGVLVCLLPRLVPRAITQGSAPHIAQTPRRAEGALS